MSNRTDIEQKRAKAAFKMAERNKNKEFKSAVDKLPAMIRTNGIANTILFVSKKNDELYKELSTYFGQTDFIKYLIENENAHKSIMSESLALVNWLRRFVKIKEL